jgi:FkbM family methyltransferase
MFERIAGKIINSIYARSGADLRLFVADIAGRNFEETTYRRLAKAGFTPGGFIDVGAYKGDWTRLANRLLGAKSTLMVEAQSALIPSLQNFAQTRPDLQIAHAVLSSEAGRQVQFHEMGTGSSIFAEASNAPRAVTVMTTQTLDNVALDFLKTTEDIFLKIDVQGAELEVLAGADEVLKKAALVQLEVAMLPYNEGAPLMPEVISWMEKRGWLPTEISGFSRPSGQLVQIDLLFAPKSSPLRPAFFRF